MRADRLGGDVATGRGLDRLDRLQLAGLGREYLLAGHLVDRAGMPEVVARLGAEALAPVAIEEWSGASPHYTRRIRRLLGFDSEHDVEAIFKGMQFDVGAPHEFLDFRYRVDDEHHGGFHLAHCGALVDVEPMGDDFVHAMCHDIEDPTFEATVCASNPRARMTPVHRPPRLPADRSPHCEWLVEIDPSTAPAPEPAPARRLASSRILDLVVPLLPLSDPDGGRTDYRGPLDPDLRLEDLSAVALRALCREFALQAHLLVLAYSAALHDRLGPSEVTDAVAAQLTGVAGVVAARLVRWMRAEGLASDDPAQLAADLLELHPAFQPRDYVDVWVDGDGETVVVLGDCAGTEEVVSLGWPALLGDGRGDDAVAAIVHAVDPHLTAVPVEAPFGRRRAWRVERLAEPQPTRPEVTVCEFSTGAAFEFARTGPRGDATA
jgi:hypothetical protein